MSSRLAGVLAGLTHAEQIEPVGLYEKAAAAQAGAGNGVEHALIGGLNCAAALADRMLVMVVREPEVGHASNVHLFDESTLPHALEDSVGGDEPEGGRPAVRAPPDLLACREVAA